MSPRQCSDHVVQAPGHTHTRTPAHTYLNLARHHLTVEVQQLLHRQRGQALRLHLNKIEARQARQRGRWTGVLLFCLGSAAAPSSTATSAASALFLLAAAFCPLLAVSYFDAPGMDTSYSRLATAALHGRWPGVHAARSWPCTGPTTSCLSQLPAANPTIPAVLL